MTLDVAVVQTDLAWCDPGANLARLRVAVEDAAAAGARLVVLPETCTTGFATADARTIAERPGGAAEQAFVDLATSHDVYVAGTFFQTPDDDPRPFNTFLVAAPDGRRHWYRKMHRFGLGGEVEHVRAGRAPTVIDIDGVRTALFTCYDLRFADDFWALAPEVDLYLVPANWPALRREHWKTLLRARAIENQAYVVACNRVGDGDGIHYAGDSMIIDPLGEVVATASEIEATLYGVVDRDEVDRVRADFPFLADRAPNGRH